MSSLVTFVLNLPLVLLILDYSFLPLSFYQSLHLVGSRRQGENISLFLIKCEITHNSYRRQPYLYLYHEATVPFQRVDPLPRRDLRSRQ